MSGFDRYIGIDYSGAETAGSSLKGLRVYLADRSAEPREVAPPPGPRRYWTRKAIAHWLVGRLSEPSRTLAGIDHGFSFPLQYFEKYGLAYDWPAFLDDFQKHWPTDEDNTYVSNGSGSFTSGVFDSRTNGVLSPQVSVAGTYAVAPMERVRPH